MNLTKIPCELIGGPLDGHRFEAYPFVGSFVAYTGKYIRGEEKTKKGRIKFRWIGRQKEVVK